MELGRYVFCDTYAAYTSSPKEPEDHQWSFAIHNEALLMRSTSENTANERSGPTTFGGTPRYHHHGSKDTMAYVVKALTWKPAPVVEEDSS